MALKLEMSKKKDLRIIKDLEKMPQWKFERQICLVYEKEGEGVSLSQTLSINMAGGWGESGNRELFSFKSKDSFMVVKQKAENLTCLVFQVRQEEMGKPSTPQKRTDNHLSAFTPRHLAGQETFTGIWI